jgi:prepilin-type N-terminal cleavage/methylation domain-containing protein/prepilin-type processing-associated H-X9-DG protein
MNPKLTAFKSSRSAAGFTLTELLVVILIIVTLAALSFVGVRTVRQSANSTRCMDNLRSWGYAIHGYAADHNGLVQLHGWASIGTAARHYETYLGGDGTSANATMDGKSVLSTQFHRRCPSQKWDGKGNGPVGYGLVQHDPRNPNEGYNINTANDPSQLLLMIDANKDLANPEDLATAVLPLCVGGSPRHRYSVNALFGDGHVSAYKAGDLKPSTKQGKAMIERWFTLR